jgi:hypothetical protein
VTTASEATTSTSRLAWGKHLARRITCPNCWNVFPPEDILFVAKHTDLVGDPVLGSNEFLRFGPARFNVKGEALDPRGVATSEMACPRCHLQVVEPLLEVPPVFVSVIGSPASGKSYFLTTMTWQLRTLLPRAGMAFSDADPVANSPLHDYEHRLFLSTTPDQPTDIIKTEQDDMRLHKTAIVDGVPVRFPLPLQFLVWPTPQHPNFNEPHRVGRVLVLYDNAGEDFQPGVEDARTAAIQHLARSNILMMLFDPVQEPRLRSLCRQDDPQLTRGLRPESGGAEVRIRQETFLREAAVRLRRYLGVSQTYRLRKPLIVAVSKFDLLQEATGISIDEEPYTPGPGAARLKIPDVEQTSDRLRALLDQHCPEFVATADSLSEIVRYIPVSSFGGSPEILCRDERCFLAVRPKDIHPRWATVPIMYCLTRYGELILEDSQARK